VTDFSMRDRSRTAPRMRRLYGRYTLGAREVDRFNPPCA